MTAAGLSGLTWATWGCAVGPGAAVPLRERASGLWRGEELASPDLSDAAVLGYDAGIRPYRRGSVRMDVEPAGAVTPGQTWVHNYGHGGSGWTLSWGCAQWAADRVRDAMPEMASTAPREVAVLGGGIVGLTTALSLRRRGIPVALYAEQLATRTTSVKAGAQFAPSLVAYEVTRPDHPTLADLLRATHARFLDDESASVGVHRKTNFTAQRGGGALRGIPDDLTQPRQLERLPIAGINEPGHAYDTLHFEPPTYLRFLQERLASAGVRFETRRFDTLADVAALPQPVVVNCLGLGAGALLRDDAMVPVRGQLVHLRPQPQLTYMISHRGYMFPRSDVVVLGGTLDFGETDTTPVEADCQAILRRHRAFFGHGQVA